MNRYQTNWLEVLEGYTDVLKIRTPAGGWKVADRADIAELRGMYELAAVIRGQPGRRIAREGLDDVIHWLKECECYGEVPRRCRFLQRRYTESLEGISASVRRVREAFARVEAASHAANSYIASFGRASDGG